MSSQPLCVCMCVCVCLCVYLHLGTINLNMKFTIYFVSWCTISMILPLNFPFYFSKGPQRKIGKYPKTFSHKLHLHEWFLEAWHSHSHNPHAFFTLSCFWMSTFTSPIVTYRFPHREFTSLISPSKIYFNSFSILYHFLSISFSSIFRNLL